MIKDWDAFAKLAIQTKLVIKKGGVDAPYRETVEWHEFPVYSDHYHAYIYVDGDIFRGGLSKPVIEITNFEGQKYQEYTLYFSEGSWADAFQFFGIEQFDAKKVFRFLSEVVCLPFEKSHLGNRNNYMEWIGASDKKKEIAISNRNGVENYRVLNVVPERSFKTFDELMDDTHKIYVEACAKHLKSDEKKAEKERDRG